jgi:hypothetical protein
MSGLLHDWRWRRRISLLACDALSGGERSRAERHAAACARCASELAGLQATLATLDADETRSAEPPIPAEFLAARVIARTREAAPSLRPAPAWRRLALPLAAAGLASLLLVPRLARELRPTPSPAAAPDEAFVLPDEEMARLERSLVREQAARYLSDAQAVFVHVAAAPQRCVRQRGNLDMEQEAIRSRELLRKRSLFVELDRDEVALARPVLRDVERLLREVAALDPCARPQDLEAIHRELHDRRLLMKIDLTTRELLG